MGVRAHTRTHACIHMHMCLHLHVYTQMHILHNKVDLALHQVIGLVLQVGGAEKFP